MSALPESLLGERGINARRILALAAVTAAGVVWAFLFAGAFGAARDGVAGGLQTGAAVTAATMLAIAARRPDPPMGRATGVVAIGLGGWAVTDVLWPLFTELDGVGVEWLNLGYAASTTLFAVAVWSTVRSPETRAAESPIAPVSPRLAVVDTVLVATGIAVWWLYTVWEPLVDNAQVTITLLLTLVDSAFLTGALVAWSRATPRRRPTVAWVLAAAVVLTGTDVGYARVFGEYSTGHVLDLGWFAACVLLGASAFQPRWGRALVSDGSSGVARWAQALVAPGLVIAVLGVVAVQPQPSAEHGHAFLDIAIWVLVGALLIRQALRLAEHRWLYRRLQAAAESSRRQADHDDLTGLLDRHAFHNRVDAVLENRRADGGIMAFLWVHLDSIGQVNDLLGTRVGDRSLVAVAERLRSTCEPGDLIARYEGADFVALRPSADESIVAWSEQVRAALAEVIEVDGIRIRLTSAIGLVETRAEHDESAGLLSDVAVAMAEIKRSGRNLVTRRRLHPLHVDNDRRVLARDLRTAIDHRQLRVHYQPICDLRTGHVLGSEALLRFEHPTRGEMGPADFLPVAEATGLMPELAMMVLHDACTTFAEDPGLGWVTVNLSESELTDPRLVDWVQSALDRTGLAPERLMIELTERVVPEPDVVRGIDRLRELGVGLALDDFGSGWTSLAQVRQLAIRVVKLDRSVVARLDDPERDDYRALLRTVVALADLLGVVVLAEGVETERQLEECRAAGVPLGQGFLWAPALPVTAMVRYVASGGPAVLDPDYRDPFVR